MARLLFLANFVLAASAFIIPKDRCASFPPALNVATVPPALTSDGSDYVAEISAENPLKVLVAGAGVGGLALAKALSKSANMDVIVLERTDEFKRFGGPIQLASNALQVIKEMDTEVFDQIMEKFTFTGDKMNGIKDGIRTEWYAKFDLAGPAEDRNMPYIGVIERPDLQEIYLNSLPEGIVRNGDGVKSYTSDPKTGSVTVELESGNKVTGDVLIGADGIWSAVRATMRDEKARGDGSGTSYSGLPPNDLDDETSRCQEVDAEIQLAVTKEHDNPETIQLYKETLEENIQQGRLIEALSLAAPNSPISIATGDVADGSGDRCIGQTETLGLGTGSIVGITLAAVVICIGSVFDPNPLLFLSFIQKEMTNFHRLATMLCTKL